MLTKKEVASALPPALKGNAESLTDILNNIQADPEVADDIRRNFISYTSVLSNGRYKLDDYLNAIAYVSFKLMGHNNEESYARAFPDRYQKLVAKGTSRKDIASYVSSYTKGKLVTAIMTQASIPTWLLNADHFQEAINTQVTLMNTAKSEMVRFQAANSLLTHLKRPETQDVNINLGVQDNDGIASLKAMMLDLAEQQKGMIQQGAATRDIAHQKLIDVTPEEDE